MPTGYTYDVQEGKITTLEDFAKSCARAFLWQARDSEEKDLRKLVADEGTLSYYQKALKTAEDELLELEGLDDATWRLKWDEAMAAEQDRLEKYNIQKMSESLRYIQMIDKVKDWEPPTEKHADMKSFMIEQLESSLKFDCEGAYQAFKPTPFQEWKKYKLDCARRDVIKYYNDVQKHSSRKQEYIDWVDQLLESVKGK